MASAPGASESGLSAPPGRGQSIGDALGVERLPRLHPGITQKIAPNKSQRGPKPPGGEALIYDALFVARWM
jgi:hypothetical protein